MFDTPSAKRARVYFMISLVLSAVLAVSHTLVMAFFYDESLFVYDRVSPFPAIIYGISAGVIVLLLVSMFSLKSNELCTKHLPQNRFSTFCSLLCGFLLIASLLLNVVNTVRDIYPTPASWRIVSLVFALPAALYFIASSFKTDADPKRLAWLSMCVIIWAGFYLISLYFEIDSPIKSPVRILNQLSLLAVMLAMVFETRILLSVARPRLYFAVTLGAVLLIALASVSDIALTIAGLRPASADSAFRLAEIAMMLYFSARLGQTLWYDGKIEEE